MRIGIVYRCGHRQSFSVIHAKNGLPDGERFKDETRRYKAGHPCPICREAKVKPMHDLLKRYEEAKARLDDAQQEFNLAANAIDAALSRSEVKAVKTQATTNLSPDDLELKERLTANLPKDFAKYRSLALSNFVSWKDAYRVFEELVAEGVAEKRKNGAQPEYRKKPAVDNIFEV